MTSKIDEYKKNNIKIVSKSIIKNIFKTLALLTVYCSLNTALAQAPNKMSYQAVVRNGSNVLVANTLVSMRISVLNATATGTAVFVETLTTTTNVNGLAAIEIGGGTPVTGTFAGIDWANGLKFIKIETDPTGGTNYSITSTSQLMSVPYALNSKTADTATLATNATNATTATTATNSPSSWSKTGNTATASDFIGTTNDQDIVFKRNGEFYGKLEFFNLSIGRRALESTYGNYNTAIGNGSNRLNLSGAKNTSVGYASLYNNTDSYNTSIGYQSLYDNTTGVNNTAIGSNAILNNINGDNNTAIGYSVGTSLTSGDNNTLVGNSSGDNITTGNNNSTIGNEARVPTATGSNQVRIGNTQVTYAGVQVAWTITSDNRWKSNIQKSNLGLDFIKELKPVSYTRKDVEVDENGTKILDKTSNPTVEYGFIAQEIETALNKFDTKNNGIISKDDAGMYGVRYNDLLAPMVKAMQEQQAMIEVLQKEITELKNKK